MIGRLLECPIEKGFEKFDVESESDGSSESESDVEDIDSDSENDEKCYKVLGDTVFEAVEVGSTVAVYSPPNASKLFYLCKVMDKGVAKQDLFVEYHHIASKGSSYLKCVYLEKISEKKGTISYKMVKGVAYVLPYQVFLPSVEISDVL